MNGVSGVILCVGPEKAGKSYTLFGKPKEFQVRKITRSFFREKWSKLYFCIYAP